MVAFQSFYIPQEVIQEVLSSSEFSPFIPSLPPDEIDDIARRVSGGCIMREEDEKARRQRIAKIMRC